MKSNIVLVLGLAAISFALGEHASAGGKATHSPAAVERVYQISALASTSPQVAIQDVVNGEARAGFELTCVIPMSQIVKRTAIAPSPPEPVMELVCKQAGP